MITCRVFGNGVTHLIVCQNQGLTASCFGKMRDWHQWNILVEHFNIHHLVYKYHTLCIYHKKYIYKHTYIIYPIIHTHTYIPWYSHNIPILMFTFTALRDEKKNDPKDVQQIFGAALKKEGLGRKMCRSWVGSTTNQMTWWLPSGYVKIAIENSHL